MGRNGISGLMSILLLIGMLAVAFNIQQTKSMEPPPTEWTRTYGGPQSDVAHSVVQTSDGGYAITGRKSGDFWLVKTDSAGHMQWNKTYGGTGFDEAKSLVQTSDGGYAIAGDTQSFGAGNDDFYLIKTDDSGNLEWNRTYGGSYNDVAWSVTQTSDGGYAIAGNGFANLVKTDADGNPLWNKTYGGITRSMVETSDGGYALAGSKGDNYWLVRTDTSGNMLWERTYRAGTSYTHHQGYSVIQTRDGGYSIAGDTYSHVSETRDIWLVKTHPDGKVQLSRTYNGNHFKFARSLIQTNDGGYAIAGNYERYPESGQNNGWLARIDAEGNMEWNQTYSEESSDYQSVVQTSDGGYAIAGRRVCDLSNYDLLLVKLAASPSRPPPVHNIDTGENFATVQEAINDPDTSHGHTILVDSGTYHSNIVVNKSVSLIGEDPINTIIDLDWIDLNAVEVTANNVMVENFTIKRARVGIYLSNSSQNIIHENNITNGATGIHLDYSSNNNISENDILGTFGWSIELASSSNNYIRGNNITGGGPFAGGISVGRLGYTIPSNNNIIIGNNIAHLDWGIIFRESFNNTLSQNVFNHTRAFDVRGSELNHFIHSIDDSNLVNGKPVYYLVNQKNRVISSETHPQVGFLAIVNSTNIEVEGLTLTGNEQGLILAYTNNSRIVNNTLTWNTIGLSLHASSNNTIHENRIERNEHTSDDYGINIELSHSLNNILSGNNVTRTWFGIVLSSSPNNTFHGNNIRDHLEGGIWLFSSNHTDISENNITNNGGVTYSLLEGGIIMYSSNCTTISGNNISGNRGSWEEGGGIALSSSHNTTISGNNITNNRGGMAEAAGIDLLSSSNSIISRNNIANNYKGISLQSSSNNYIYHNNLVDNTEQMYSEGSLNFWDDGYPSGGNYWSDYIGVDLYYGPNQDIPSSDGIWDHPYTLDSNNTDNYPLVKPYVPGNLSVSIHLDKYNYHSGDKMYLGLNVENPDSVKYLCFAIWVKLPDGSLYWLEEWHWHSVLLPIGLSYTSSPFKFFILPTIPSGNYTWHAAFLDRTTHTMIVEDTAEWQFS